LASAICLDSALEAGYFFDVVDRVTNIVWRDSSDNVVKFFDYDYDNANMITNVTRENGERVIYAYDSLDRLTGETRKDSGGTVLYDASFKYDLAGNRTNAVVNGSETNYTLGVGNRLASWTGGGEMKYNEAGCVTVLVYNSSQRVDLAWNDRYQVTAAYTNGVLAESFRYDPLGRRVFCSSRTQGGSFDTNWIVYEGAQAIAEVDSAGNLKKSYTYAGLDNPMGMTIYEGSTSNRYFFVTDHQGTVHRVCDVTGAIVETYKYSAWGEVLEVRDGDGDLLAKSAIGNNILWQGREYSWATGLYFFRARWYDPITGRWLSNDPIGISGGLNQYVFCNNNPVNFRDPLGLCKGGDGAYAGMPGWAAWFYKNLFDPFYHHNGFGRQMLSMGYAGGSAVNWLLWRDSAASEYMGQAMANSGQRIMGEANAGSGWYYGYWGALGVSAAADAVAAWPMVTRAVISEIGAKSFSDAAWTELGLGNLSNYERGLYFLDKFGVLRALWPTARGIGLGMGTKAFGKGPTVAAWVLGPVALDAGARGTVFLYNKVYDLLTR
jgi:RHS repeat-associated protein